jgi:hypothetical protein
MDTLLMPPLATTLAWGHEHDLNARKHFSPILGSDALNYAIAFSSQELRRTSLICLLQSLDVELDHFPATRLAHVRNGCATIMSCCDLTQR